MKGLEVSGRKGTHGAGILNDDITDISSNGYIKTQQPPPWQTHG
jgi:hypothetical protein